MSDKKPYEERHTIICQSGTKPEEVRDYLNSQGFSREIFYFNGSGALVVKIIETKREIIRRLEETFGERITIFAQHLECDHPVAK